MTRCCSAAAAKINQPDAIRPSVLFTDETCQTKINPENHKRRRRPNRHDRCSVLIRRPNPQHDQGHSGQRLDTMNDALVNGRQEETQTYHSSKRRRSATASTCPPTVGRKRQRSMTGGNRLLFAFLLLLLWSSGGNENRHGRGSSSSLMATAYLLTPSLSSFRLSSTPRPTRIPKPITTNWPNVAVDDSRRSLTPAEKNIGWPLCLSSSNDNGNDSRVDNEEDNAAVPSSSSTTSNTNNNILPSYRRLVSYILATVLLWSCESVQSLIDTTAVAAQGPRAPPQVVLLQVAALSPATTLCDFLIYLTYFLAMATTHQLSHALAGSGSGSSNSSTTTTTDVDQETNGDNNNNTSQPMTNQKTADYYRRLRRITSNVLGVAAISGIILTILVWIWGDSWLQRMVLKETTTTASAASSSDTTLLLHYASQYTRIRATALTAAILNLTGQAVCLVTFQTPTAVAAMFTAFTVNALGNAVLTRGFGLAGAAWATVLASGTSCAILLRAIRRQMKEWRGMEEEERRREEEDDVMMEQSNVSPESDELEVAGTAQDETTTILDTMDQLDLPANSDAGPSAMEQVRLQQKAISNASSDEDNSEAFLEQLQARRREINQEYEQGERTKRINLSDSKHKSKKRRRLRPMPSYILDSKDGLEEEGEQSLLEITNATNIIEVDGSRVDNSFSESTPPTKTSLSTSTSSSTWLSLFSIPTRREFQTLLNLAGPLSLVNLSVIACYAAMTVKASEFGVVALAAHNVLESCFFLFGCFGDAIAQATQAFLPAAAAAQASGNESEIDHDSQRSNSNRSVRPSLYHQLWKRLLIVTTVVGLMNSQLSQIILSLFGRYLMADGGGGSSTLLSVAPASFGYLRLSLLVHPLVLLLEGSILSFGQIRPLLVCYGLTITFLGGLLKWTCHSFDHIWRSLFWFQTFRFLSFGIVRLYSPRTRREAVP